MTVDVQGLKELEASLKTVQEELQVKGIRTALRAGGRVFLESMRSMVRRSPGRDPSGKTRRHLVDDLRVRTSVPGGVPTAKIGPGRKTRHIANWLEFGTAPHLIKARRAKALFIPGGHPITEVHHPGAPAKPFIRPAFDTQWRAALDAYKDVLARQIARFTK